MCVDPLKGYVTSKGYVCKVSRYACGCYYCNKSGDYRAIYNNKDLDKIRKYKEVITDYIDLPCRKCPECYAQMRREWIARAVAEAQEHTKMCFLTLTYSNINLPVVKTVDSNGVIYNHPTLRHSHFQEFMRRLRLEFSDRKLRFFCCGEYGSRTYRPHYHAVIYGLDALDIKGCKVYSRNNSGDLLFKSDYMDLNLWQKGYCIIGECSTATIAYIAGYVDKKDNVVRGDEFYKLCGIEKPYIRSSNKPGLGRAWLDKTMHKYKDLYDYVSVKNGLSEPTKIYLTEYWKKVVENNMLTDGEFCYIIDYDDSKVARRQKFNDKRLLLELEGSDLSKTEYLLMKKKLLQKKRVRKVRDF